MAKISLRSYGKEIESLIDRGQYDQALAHCRHILRYYPKHIETYRLMAKAYLEATRYGDASDVFQRVLSSVPDDFVSQLGMSIIREDEGNLDAAIWHMERAFEIQPANVAIQSELRRLYGRRDGMEPPRVRLTRGALARMYLKGELFQQAISELRAALNTDPSRTDLQVVLAQAYLRAGQRVEAADTCSAVLKKLPYCLEANRILAEILSATERAQDAAIYHQRAIAMNPYLGQLTPKATTPDQVPDEAVVVERLDLKAEPADSGHPSQPQWAASLGVAIESSAQKKEDVPDWLADLEGIAHPKDQSSETPAPPKISPFVIADLEKDELTPFLDQTSTPESETSENVIPDWMQEAGWMLSKEANDEAEMGFTLDERISAEESGLAPAEIPSWLREMAPKEAFESPEEPMDIDPLLVKALDASATPWLEETPPGTGDTITSWLEDQGKVTPQSDEGSAGLPLGGAGMAAAGLAAWAALEGREPEEEIPSSEAPALQSEQLPDWLSETAGETPSLGAEDRTPQQSEDELVWDELAPPEAAAPGEIPDWLIALGPAMAIKDEITSETPEGQPVEAETPDWLKDLAPAGEASQEQEDFDWLESLQPESGIGEAALPVLGLGIGAMLEDEEPSAAEGEAAAEIFDTGEWIPETFTLEEEPASAELASTLSESAAGPEIPVEQSLPEWLREVNPEETVSAGASSEVDEGSLPAWLREMEGSADAGSISAGEETLPWSVLAAGMAAESQPLEWLPSTTPDEEMTDLDWLEEEAVQSETLDEWLVTGVPLDDLESSEPLSPLGDWESTPAEPESLLAEVAAVPEVIPDLEASPPTYEEELPEWLVLADEPAAPSVEAQELAKPTEQDLATGAGLAIPLDLEVAAEAAQDNLPETLELHPAEEQPEEPGVEFPTLLAAGIAAQEIFEEDTESGEAAAETSAEIIQDQAEPVIEEEPAPAELSEEEAAFAWLENLAVKQGATEALMYSEEERLEEPPAWVKAEAETEPAAEAAVETPVELSEPPVSGTVEPSEPEAELEEAPQLPDWLLAVAAAGAITEAVHEETPQAKEEKEVDTSSPQTGETQDVQQEELDAAYAWLETLAVRQGAEEALLLTPEERQAEAPEWVKAVAEAEAAQEELEQLPEDIVVEEEGETLAEAPIALFAADLESEDFLEQLYLESEEALPGDITEAALEAEAAGEAEPVPDLPDWLAGLEEEILAPAAETLPDEFSEPLETMPETARLDINQASLIEIERLPGVGFVRAQALLEYRQSYGPLQSLDELAAVEGFDPELVEMLREHAEVAPRPVEATPAAPGSEPAVVLEEARNALRGGNVETAVRNYQAALHQADLLPEVIKDLNDALYRYPVDVSIWMTLGDAQMRSGSVQEALDAYTKAEELIR